MRAARTVTAATLVFGGIGGVAAEGASAMIHTAAGQASSTSSTSTSQARTTALIVTPVHTVADPWTM